jgi:hypothetical protein
MFSCVLIDIVPVSSEQPIEVFEEELQCLSKEEQVFEEELQCLSKEGKWTSPPAYSIFGPTQLA